MDIIKIKIRKSPIVLSIQLLILALIFNFLYLIVSIIGDAMEGANEVALFSLVQYDTLILVVLIIIQTIIVILLVVDWLNNYYVYQENSIIHHSGIITKKNFRYTLQNIEYIRYEKSIAGKIFDYGTIMIKDVLNSREFRMRNIHSPEEFVEKFEKDIKNLPNTFIKKQL